MGAAEPAARCRGRISPESACRGQVPQGSQPSAGSPPKATHERVFVGQYG